MACNGDCGKAGTAKKVYSSEKQGNSKKIQRPQTPRMPKSTLTRRGSNYAK